MAKILYSANRKQADAAENPFWISYADLMTALVMLFLVVMSISMVTIATKSVNEKRTRAEDIESLLEQVENTADQKNLDLDVNKANYTITFGKRARFAHDSYQLSKEAIYQLQGAVPVLLQSYASKLGRKWLKRIHIEGFTDETGSYLYNVNLSLKRAQAVVCALFAKEGMSKADSQLLQKLLIIDGASTTSIKESKEESRRVEVRLEFRRVNEVDLHTTVPEMNMGNCVLQLEGLK